MSKYHSKKVTVNGITYDSKKEYKRHQELLLLEKAGLIKDLERQVRFVLIPAQYEPDTIGARGGVKRGKLIERECAYTADFVYKERLLGKEKYVKSGWIEPERVYETVVEDSKGFRTKEYRIKKKLLLWVHGIRIRET